MLEAIPEIHAAANDPQFRNYLAVMFHGRLRTASARGIYDGSEVDDLVNETFCRVLSVAPAAFNDARHARAFIILCGRNAFRHRQDKRRRTCLLFSEIQEEGQRWTGFEDSTTDQPAALASLHEDRGAMWRAFQGLADAGERVVATLFYLHGLKAADVARQVGRSVRWVELKLQAARVALSRAMGVELSVVADRRGQSGTGGSIRKSRLDVNETHRQYIAANPEARERHRVLNKEGDRRRRELGYTEARKTRNACRWQGHAA